MCFHFFSGVSAQKRSKSRKQSSFAPPGVSGFRFSASLRRFAALA